MLRGDAEGFCDSFEIEIALESSESESEIANLVRLARKMCFTEKALTGTIPVSVSQKLNQKIFNMD